MEKTCCRCDRPVPKDVIALNKKLLDRSTRHFLCLACLADYLDSTEDELCRKIDEFKEQGCALFV